MEFSVKNGKDSRRSVSERASRHSRLDRIEINHLKVPENTEKTGITLYLGKGCTGKVYYDDLTVTPGGHEMDRLPAERPHVDHRSR